MLQKKTLLVQVRLLRSFSLSVVWSSHTVFFSWYRWRPVASMALHEAHKLIFLNPRQSYVGESSLLQGGPIQSELTPSAGQITAQLFSLLDPAVLGNAWAELGCWSHSFVFLPSQHMEKVQGGAGHSLLCRIIWDLFRAVMQLCWSVSDFSWAPSLRLSLH